MEKNKLLLNEYLGDFMHFETLFFFFLENDLFQTHPPTKVWKIPNFFFYFLTPSLNKKEQNSKLTQTYGFNKKTAKFETFVKLGLTPPGVIVT